MIWVLVLIMRPLVVPVPLVLRLPTVKMAAVFQGHQSVVPGVVVEGVVVPAPTPILPTILQWLGLRAAPGPMEALFLLLIIALGSVG